MIVDEATRDVIRTEVARRMADSKPAQQHTHIECWCPDRKHRRNVYDTGCFCPSCASKAAVALGYPATDTDSEAEGPDDSPQFCEDCGVLITTEGITADGIDEELTHWMKQGGPKTASDWREFHLCLAADVEREKRADRVLRGAALSIEVYRMEEIDWARIVTIVMRETPWRAPEMKGRRKFSRAMRKANRSFTNGAST